MQSRLEELERKVDALAKTVEQLAARLDAQGAAPAATATAEPLEAPVVAPKPEATELLTRTVSLVGRTSLVFGGAFLIRAMTDRDVVPHGVGVSLGLAFAVLWVALAWRAAGLGLNLSACFHVGSAALIGFPLIAETATRFAILSAPAAAAVLAGFSGLMLFTAWRTRHRLTAWLGVGGGVATAAFLLQRADAPGALALVLLFLALGSVALGDVRGWPGLRWPVALVLDFVVLRRVFSTSALPEKADQVGEATLLAMATVLLYLGALAWGTWRRARNVGGFEVVQTVLAVTIGVAVAARVEPAHGAVTLATGCLALLLFGAAVVTAAKTSDRPDHGIDVWFYGLLGLSLVISGGLLLTRGPLVTFLWSTLALAAAVLGRRVRTLMMWVFASVLAFASGIAGDVVGLVNSAFLAAPEQALHLDVEASAVVAVLFGCWLATAWRVPGVSGSAAEGGHAAATDDAVPRGAATGPRAVAALLLFFALLGAASLIVLGVRVVVPTTDVSLVILVRTLVLVGGALALGYARRVGPRELAWIAWVSLGCAGLKMLAQDLPSSRASTLFISLFAFGGAIISLPYLIRPRNLRAKPG